MNPANSQEALSQLQSTQTQAQNPNDILASQRQQLGVQGAQDTVTGLRGAINNTTKALQQVAPSVMGRTQNSLVTNAQAGKIIGNEQAPIQQTLTQQGTQYNQAGEDAAKLEGQAKDAASGIYAGQQDKLSYLQNIYNSLYKREQDAAALAEQQRQFNSKASAGSGGFNLGGSTPEVAPTQAGTIAPDEQAYTSVQKFLNMGEAAALSDYQATLASAQRGNAIDKLKIQLYNQAGINPKQGVGSVVAKGIAAGAKK